ncbi:unnamed protein product [Macrosiphum euphorbiae]|uniref:Uncharacterized protein n=1 Tax=Macrosiphum euphorbiae TaxID=13131 RepID=A0AAV0VN16_9HEMI|nr:unnamed protein product [Macrosiphum euphorbiae]
MEPFVVQFNNKKLRLCEDEPGELYVADTPNKACNSQSTLPVQNECHIFNGKFFKLVEGDGNNIGAQSTLPKD